MVSWSPCLRRKSFPAIRGATSTQSPADPVLPGWELFTGPQDSPSHDLSWPYFGEMYRLMVECSSSFIKNWWWWWWSKFSAFCLAAYYNPGLCPQSRPSRSLFLGFLDHIPECCTTHVLFGSSQGAQPLQSREPGAGLTPPETLQQSFPRECTRQVQIQVQSLIVRNFWESPKVIVSLTADPFWCSHRPGKSPERGSRQMESYEPISPPQSYQCIDKQEAGGPPSQRREAESEIRCGSLTVYFGLSSLYL